MTEDEAHDVALLQLDLEAMTNNRDDWKRTAEAVAEEVDDLEAEISRLKSLLPQGASTP